MTARILSVRVALFTWLALAAAVLLIMPEKIVALNLASIVLALIMLAIMFPGAALTAAVIIAALIPGWWRVVDTFVRENLTALDNVQTVTKVVLVLIMIPAVARYGARSWFNAGIIALIVMVLETFSLSTRYPSLDSVQVAKTFVGFALPFFCLNLPIQRRWIDPGLTLIALIPTLMVLLGVVAELSGIVDLVGNPWAIMSRDETGVYRLGGSSIPAALAFFAYIAVFVCMFQAIVRKKKRYYWLAGINLVMLILTFTRTPIVAAIAFSGACIFFASPRDLRGSQKFLFALIGGTVVIGLCAVFWSSIETRFFGQVYNESGLNTSGRAVIWDTVLKAYEVNPLFGRGLGTAPMLTFVESNGKLANIAPHNEYLHLLLDGGIFGMVVFILGLGILLFRESRVLSPTGKSLIFALFLSFAGYSYTDNTISGTTTVTLFYALALIFALARYEQADRREAAR
jgi:O-antigen ligase